MNIGAPPIRGTTGANGALTRVLLSSIVSSMHGRHRDLQIVRSVATWTQLSSSQIRELHFAHLKSATPLYRALNRLVDRKYLYRVPRREVGGYGSGSAQDIYELGQQGWLLVGGKGQFHPWRKANLHTLSIPDVFLELVKLQRQGRIKINGYSAEPDSHVSVGGLKVRPDLYVEIADIHKREDQAYWFEIDMGTERKKAITEKLEGYIRAAQHADDETIPIWPLVVFIVPDEDRQKEIEGLVNKLHPENRDLFLVTTANEFAALLF